MLQPAFPISGLKLYQLISVVDNIGYGTKTATLQKPSTAGNIPETSRPSVN